MRRVRDVWEQIASFSALLAACAVAARGNRRSSSVLRFLHEREPELLRLQAELEAGAWRPGPLVHRVILVPKRRTIGVSPFRDRIVHHALVAPLEARFDAYLGHAAYACRRGRGQHVALRAAQRYARTSSWYLRTDIEHCFETLSHAVVLDTVARLVKDRRARSLCARVLEAVPGGIGVPIGSLTSQWFANLVLARLDHHLTASGFPRLVRYMDDLCVWGATRAEVERALALVRHFVPRELALCLKERATEVGPTRDGMAFLGWRVFPGLLRIGRPNWRRIRRRWRALERAVLAGHGDEAALALRAQGWLAHLRCGNTRGVRRALFHTGDAPT